MFIGLPKSLKTYFASAVLCTLSVNALATEEPAPAWVHDCENKPPDPRCYLLSTQDMHLRNTAIEIIQRMSASYWRAVYAQEAAQRLDRMARSISQSIDNTPEKRRKVTQQRQSEVNSARATSFMAHKQAKGLFDQYGCNDRHVKYVLRYLENMTTSIQKIDIASPKAGLDIKGFLNWQRQLQEHVTATCSSASTPTAPTR